MTRRTPPADRPVPTGGSVTRHVPYLALIVGWALLVYLNSFDNNFHFDDLSSIKANPSLRSFESLHKGLRFVTYFSFYLNLQTTGLDERPFHIVNFAIHALNALLVYAIALLLGRRAGAGETKSGGNAPSLLTGGAFFAALFFALHPLNTEPVNYIVQRSILLSTFFLLLAFLFFLKAWPSERGTLRPIFRVLWLAGALVCFGLSILSKEVGAVFLLIAFAYLYYFVCRDRKSRRRAVLFGVGAAGLLAVFIVAFGAWDQVASRLYLSRPDAATQIVRNLMTQSQAAVQYLMLGLFPFPSRLNVDHDLPRVVSLDFPTVVSMAVLLVLLAGLVLSFKKHRLASFLILWLFLTHLPTTVLTSAEAMVEYRNYPALVGFVLLLVMLARATLPRFGISGLFPPVAGLILALGYSAAVVQRNQVWRDSLTLWQDAAAKSPRKARPRQALSNYFLKQKQYKLAIQEGEKALQIDRMWMPSYLTLGIAHSMVENHSEAIKYLQVVIDGAGGPRVTRRDLGTAHNNMGASLVATKKQAEAEAAFRRSIEAWPENGPPYANLANILLRTKRFDEGLVAIQKAIEFESSNHESYLLRGTLLFARDRNEEAAMRDFKIAADLNRQKTRAYFEKILARSPAPEQPFLRRVLDQIQEPSPK